MAYCANCGSEVAAGVAYCPNCGRPQHPAATAARGGTNGSAVASLVLGIAGFVVCPLICSVLAITFGNRAQREIAADRTQEGEGMAKAGVVLGWIGVGITALGLLIVLVAAAATPR